MTNFVVFFAYKMIKNGLFNKTWNNRPWYPGTLLTEGDQWATPWPQHHGCNQRAAERESHDRITPSCRQTPSWLRVVTSRATICCDGSCGSLACSSTVGTMYVQVCNNTHAQWWTVLKPRYWGSLKCGKKRRCQLCECQNSLSADMSLLKVDPHFVHDRKKCRAIGRSKANPAAFRKPPSNGQYMWWFYSTAALQHFMNAY